MICPKCGTPNRASAKFCDECGYELPSVAPIANEMFDDKDHVVTCKPKTAPTADLNGIDKTNDSSFDEHIKEDAEKEEDETNKSIESDITAVIDPVELPKSTNTNLNVEAEAEKDDLDTQKTAKLDIIDTKGESGESKAKVYSVNNDAEKEQKKEKKPIDPKTKRNVLIALGTIAVIAILLSVTYFAQIWGGKVVPDVTSLSESDAKSQLQAAGFKVETEQVASDEVEGIVLSMKPQSGSRLAEGSTISLEISMKRVIPSIVGMNIDDAKQVMSKNGFTNVEYITQKSDDAENVVLSVTPEVDTRSASDANVRVVVSVPYRVPDVEGLSQDEAIAKIEEAGFVAKTEEKYDENKEEGSVLSVEPAKDSALKSGSDVKIFICAHRSTKLVQLTRDFFSETTHFTIDGKQYELGKLTAVQWTSGGTVAYTITARQYQTTTWFGSSSETRYLDYETIQGAISYDDNNNIISTSPSIRQG